MKKQNLDRQKTYDEIMSKRNGRNNRAVNDEGLRYENARVQNFGMSEKYMRANIGLVHGSLNGALNNIESQQVNDFDKKSEIVNALKRIQS